MRSSTFALLILLAAPLALANPGPATPSSTPCIYTCPPQDLGLYTLGSFTDTGGKLTCVYPVYSGETSFSCEYSDTTGALTNDLNAGVCTQTAVQTCTSKRSYKSEDNLTAFQAKKLARAAQPLVDGAITDAMKKRSHLHKSRMAVSF